MLDLTIKDPKKKCFLLEVLRQTQKVKQFFNEVATYFQENNIPLKNIIIACATDGAPSMTGRYKGFYCTFKKGCPGSIFVFTV